MAHRPSGRVRRLTRIHVSPSRQTPLWTSHPSRRVEEVWKGAPAEFDLDGDGAREILVLNERGRIYALDRLTDETLCSFKLRDLRDIARHAFLERGDGAATLVTLSVAPGDGPRTPSLASGTLTRHFQISGDFEGHALLDVPTQRLRYELKWPGVPGDERIDLKLHREEKDGAGPVIALLGKDRRGEIAVRNEDLDSLLAGKIYFALYTRQKPLGAARAWILNAAER